MVCASVDITGVWFESVEQVYYYLFVLCSICCGQLELVWRGDGWFVGELNEGDGWSCRSS
jgi:hypothetical protein